MVACLHFKTVPLYIIYRHHIVSATKKVDSVWCETKVALPEETPFKVTFLVL